MGNFHDLADRLEARFAAGGAGPWSAAVFEEWALLVFRHQYEVCAPYRSLCDARGVTPETVARWEDAPLVPATGFKHFDFLSFEGVEVEATFRTSGTTRGQEVRGRHHVPRLSLYRAAALSPLEAALLPDGERMRMVSLIPPPEAAPESSLSAMIGFAVEARATSIDWLVDANGDWGPDTSSVLSELADGDEPILLFGTALSFVHALEREGRGGQGLPRLPEGSRVMETGGFKGARREVSREELYRRVSERTGLPTHRIVNEYGMTELLSQLWEPVLTEGDSASGVHVPAPWLRVRALDPITLAPLPEGREGILAFFDLANLGSVAHVLTEDIGSVSEGRVRLRGRAAGAEPRGCSRAMDELMSASAR